MSSGLTGPIKLSNEDMEKFYHRVKDICNMLVWRGYGLAANPEWKHYLKDVYERMVEDDTWPHKNKVPPLVLSKDVDRLALMAVDTDTMKTITFEQVNNSRKGFGKFKGLLIPESAKLHDVDWAGGRDDIAAPLEED